MSDQFSAAVAAANDSLARAAAARAEEERAAEAVESMLGVRRVLISRVESLDADAPPEALAAGHRGMEEPRPARPSRPPAIWPADSMPAVKGIERRKRDRARTGRSGPCA